MTTTSSICITSTHLDDASSGTILLYLHQTFFNLFSAIFAFSSIVHSADVRLSKGMDTMARKVYAELVDLPDNMVISPLSIFTAMGLLQRGAPEGSRTRLQLHIATMGRLVQSTILEFLFM